MLKGSIADIVRKTINSPELVTQTLEKLKTATKIFLAVKTTYDLISLSNHLQFRGYSNKYILSYIVNFNVTTEIPKIAENQVNAN